MASVDDKLDEALRIATSRQGQRSAVDDKLDVAMQAAGAASDTTPQWSDLPGNIIPSAIQMGEDMLHVGMYPRETLLSLGMAGYGGVQRLADDWFRTPEEAQARRNMGGWTTQSDRMAEGMGDYFDDRYGGWNELKNTAITDPVGALADVSTVLTGAAGLARGVSAGAGKMGSLSARVAGAGGRIAGGAGKVARGLNRAADLTDPVTLAARGVATAAKGGSRGLSAGAGMTTGAGAEPIEAAYAAGRRGGKAADTFTANMRGRANLTDVVDEAKAGVEAIRQKAQRDYLANMASTRESRAVLPFDDVLSEYDKLRGSMLSERGMPKIDPAEMRQIDDIGNILLEYVDRPELHTPLEMDALRQRIRNTLTDSPANKQVRRFQTQLSGKIKGMIEGAAPEYAKAMQSYSEAADLVDELERTLSLNDRAQVDTTLRKLQSVMRNNVNTNYGERGRLLDQLEREGNVSLRPALAGQALDALMPRGVQGPMAGLGLGGLGYATMGPFGTAAMLPLTSPRVMGEAAYAAGRASRPIAGAAEAARPAIPSLSQRLAAAQIGRMDREAEVRGILDAYRRSQ